MRTVIKELAKNEVQIKFYDDCGTKHDWIIWANISGGYIYSDNGDRRKYGTLGFQVCDRLCNSGSTLYWTGKEPLSTIVRREYRRMRYEERNY